MISGFTPAVMGEYPMKGAFTVLIARPISYDQDDDLPNDFLCYKCFITKVKRTDRSSFYENASRCVVFEGNLTDVPDAQLPNNEAHSALITLAPFRKALSQLYWADEQGEKDILARCQNQIRFGNFLREQPQVLQNYKSIDLTCLSDVDPQDASPIWEKLQKEEYVIPQAAAAAHNVQSQSSQSSSSDDRKSGKSQVRARASRSTAQVLVLNK